MYAIIGAGALAKEVAALRPGAVGFYVDPEYGSPGDEIWNGLTILGNLSDLADVLALNAVVAIGDPNDRWQVVKKARKLGVRLNPSALVMPGAIVSFPVTLGKYVLVGHGANVNHDCVLEDFVTLAPGVILGGRVTVKERTLLGLGAIVLPGVTVGYRAIVGAGAVVTKDVLNDATVKGMPAE